MQNLTISEWNSRNIPTQNTVSFDYLSFFTGVIVALIGVILTIAWDKYKSYKQEKNSLTTIAHELETNILEIKDNKYSISQELIFLEQRKTIVKPLIKLNDDFSSFLIMNCPSLFKNQTNLLEEVRKISKLTREINETIQSRESYRISNGAMTNYENRIKI
ncbi:MAG: hypothetical protein PHX25_01365 [Candidatus Pacebacteria bacterium]|nr:hypothetical protein [Candidatus Paceibacterota bacterium]